MLPATMRSAVTLALRPCARGLTAKSLPSHGALVRRSFLIAPSYKSRVAVRGFAATATASKTTGRTAAKAATKPKPKPKAKAKATTTKAKKTAKAPAKKAAAKPAAGRKKKEISPEKRKVLLRRELKKKAMLNQEPKNLPTNPWLVFSTTALKAQAGGVSVISSRVPALAAEFKNLSSSELERLRETAIQNKAINAGNYKTWVESHSVADIIAANQARLRLKRECDVTAHPLKIVDERVPKRPATNGFAYFTKAKRADDPHAAIGAFAKQLSQQWRTLSEAEKRPYADLAAAEWAKYSKAMEKFSL
ncbi:hmg box protein [Diaporthe amygdali]|uniref:hmg box protein n=1 Tax=Phomopsis amygdali TaxID=1214568 RepID=UPI0022FEB3F7|nr:hmg box protein [Diaporthe amygdali]KAJ0121385.1 hmg box protein [Diaporthe amygdali]